MDIEQLKCSAKDLQLPDGLTHAYIIDDMRVMAQYLIDKKHDGFLGRWDTVIGDFKCTVKKWMPYPTNPLDMRVEEWLRAESNHSKELLKDLYLTQTETSTELNKF